MSLEILDNVRCKLLGSIIIWKYNLEVNIKRELRIKWMFNFVFNNSKFLFI